MFAFLLLFAWFVFFLPDYLGHADNYMPANPLVTPPHIVPEWYFLPFYAILRAIPSKLFGVIAMFSAIIVLLFVPWLDTSRVRSTKYRPLYRWFFWLFVFSCRGARLARLQAAGCRVRVLGARLHDLLLRALPCRDADRRAGSKRRSRCRARSPRRCSADNRAPSWRRPRPDGGSHETTGAHVAPCGGGTPRGADAGRRRLPIARRGGGGRAPHIERQDWTFGGFTGQYDKAQLQRGFQVYQQVCSACHGLKRVRFRNLAEPGGPEFPEAERQGARRRMAVPDLGRARRQGNPFDRATRPRRSDPRPLQERQAGARGAERRAAARSVAHRQGAQRREPRRPGTSSGSRCCATWPPAIRKAARTISMRC